MDLSIVIPAYREADRLGLALTELASFLERSALGGVEVLVVSAGDGDTADVARAHGHLFERLVVLGAPDVGKGESVHLGMLAARGRRRVFMDADLATPLPNVGIALALLGLGADVAIGVRDLGAAHRGLRRLVSRAGNRLVRALLLPGIRDTQCGFKAFTAEAAEAIFGRLTLTGWGFDVEALVIASELGYRIEAFDVPDWRDVPGGSFSRSGILRAATSTLGDLLAVRVRRSRGVYRKPVEGTGTAPARDREFTGGLVYMGALAVTAVLAYVFTAMVGRRLPSQDFATFVALVGVLLALSAPVTAILGGAAMAATRSATLPALPARRAAIATAAVAVLVGVLPVPVLDRAMAWIVFAWVMSFVGSWNRGLLIGIGRIGLVGATFVLEGIARVGFALVFLLLGWGLAGASAGLALGIAGGALISAVPLRARSGSRLPGLPAEVLFATGGLLFLGLVQFADVVAIRLVGAHAAGPYAAASSMGRVAMFLQVPAAAYALRRSAVAGPRAALRKALALALVPGVAWTVLLQVAPAQVLSMTYGGRFVAAAGTARLLAVAMLLSGLALVLVHLMMGAGRTVWVWSMAVAGTAVLAVIFSVAGAPDSVAVVMLAGQAAVLAVAAYHAHRLLSAERGAERAVLILNWRDTKHPQGGGSEVYVEELAKRLARSGRKVTIFCAEHEFAPREETLEGVRIVRRGSWRTVYLWALAYHLMGRFGRHDVVIDVENGIPFFSPLYCGRPVVVLVHHVHPEQWRMVFGPLLGRVGWLLESRFMPFAYRRARFVAVSNATKGDLATLGVDPRRVSVVRNGVTSAAAPNARGAQPSIAFLGRLVPHKRLEFLLDAAAELREEFPGLRVRVMGRGPCEPELRAQVEELGLADTVSFEGFVDEAEKHRVLADSWVLALPSVKEGWGVSVIEAGLHGTPTVAFRVGGLVESVRDGETGLLVDDRAGFVQALRSVLRSEPFRERLGAAARGYAAAFSWDDTAVGFDAVLREVTERVPEAVPAIEPQLGGYSTGP